MSVAEQRYRAVLAVISDGRTVTDVAAMVGGLGKPCTGFTCSYPKVSFAGFFDHAMVPTIRLIPTMSTRPPTADQTIGSTEVGVGRLWFLSLLIRVSLVRSGDNKGHEPDTS